MKMESELNFTIFNDFRGKWKSFEKEEILTRKQLMKHCTKLEQLDESILEMKNIIQELKSRQSHLSNSVEELNTITRKYGSEIVELNNAVKAMKTKYQALEQNLYAEDFNINKSDLEKFFKKRLQLNIIKNVMKVFIDGNAPSHILTGFAGNICEKKLFPFRLDITNMTNEEKTNEMWEISKRTSSHIKEWERLFQIEK